MSNMTWAELETFISQNVTDKNSQVIVYDMSNGNELFCDFIELKEGEGWKPTIAINIEEEFSEEDSENN